jgi:prefoldin subunit 5
MQATEFLNKGMSNLDSLASALDAKMKDITQNGKEMKQEDLIMLQYALGRYQGFITMLSHVVTSIQDQTKELAKSIH